MTERGGFKESLGKVKCAVCPECGYTETCVENTDKIKSYKLNMREYYLRCALYESIIPLGLLVEWQKNTMQFINEKLYKIIDELKSIKTEKDYINFCNKYEKLINYVPEFKNLKGDYVICSHAFINTIDFSKDERIKIDFKSDKNILIERFKKRENITETTFDKNIELYYKSYEEVLKDSVSNILDITDKETIAKINKLI